MNKKRAISVLALIVVLALAVGILVACNHYEWNSVGMGESGANVVSNGGYVVEQGKYVYFINGYVGDNDNNEWGTPYKQSIMRAEKNADGTINNDTAVVVVPKSIYNKSVNGGFAIYGDWIYYATPNNEKDKNGTPSTTHTDFMRTRTDGAITQRIGTINSRESEYLFTPTRVLYRTNTSTVYYFDFSGMRTDKSLDNGKGVTSGTLIENASSIMWGYDADWAVNAGTVVSDYVFYTETITGDDSYKHYNNLCAIKYDGSDKRVLATIDSYLAEGEDDVNNYQKVFTFALGDIYFENDDTVTLYYSKSIYENAASSNVGHYSNTFSVKDGFSVANEKKVTSNNLTAFYALGGDKGVLAAKDSNLYLLNGTDNYSDANLVVGGERSATVQGVVGDYVYYTVSNSTALYRINLVKGTGSSPNEDTVIKEGVKSDWLSIEFIGNRVYFFNTEDYSYVNYVDLDKFTGDELAPTLVGKMTQADLEAKEKEEEENEDKE